MNHLFRKNELIFSLIAIAVYVVGSSIADSIGKAVTLIFHLALSVILIGWLWQNGRFKTYGLCGSRVAASRFLWYIPLIVVVTRNFWCGIQLTTAATEAALYVGSMLCVGFLEELLFRGFLFKAMAKTNRRAAIIVSSVTFGIGHIVNLFNGSGMTLVANVCQIACAVAFGFLFVVIFDRGGSLWPCIIAHCFINTTSVFDVTPDSATTEIVLSLIMCVIIVGYTLVLLKTLPKKT